MSADNVTPIRPEPRPVRSNAPPIARANPLCGSDHPSDTVLGARAVAKFMHFAGNAGDGDGNREDTEYQDGKHYVWAMIHDALGYAEEQIQHREQRSESAPVDCGEGSDDEADSHTGPRIRAFLASMQPMRGVSRDMTAYHRGRATIEQVANSAQGEDSPHLDLTAAQCADIMDYVVGSEPVEARDWWRDPKHGPSHVVGYYMVIEVVMKSLKQH